MAEWTVKLDGKTGYSASIVAAINEIRAVIDAGETPDDPPVEE